MKKFKIMRIASLHYDKPLQFLSDNQFSSLSYIDQQRRLFDNFFVYGNGFAKGMNLLGHDAVEIVADAEILQKTWAKENNISYNEYSWRQDIILKQIELYKPEIIYFQDIHALHYDNFKTLKEKFTFIKLIVIFRGFPRIDSILMKVLPIADLIFVGSPSLFNQLREKNIPCHLMYHFFDEDIYKFINLKKIKSIHDFTFIGSSGFGYGVEHLPRYATLLELINRTDLKLWIDERKYSENKFMFLKKVIKSFSFLKKIKSLSDFYEQVAHVNKYCKNNSFQYVKKNDLIFMKPLHEIFPTRCFTSLFGQEMYKLFAESKITFNIHTLAANGFADNMRLFHVTGMGSCLLTDDCHNMGDLFEKDNEIVTYSNIDECVEKVNYLLNNEEERKKIAKNGQARTLKNHSYKIRCEQMNEIFQKSIR